MRYKIVTTGLSSMVSSFTSYESLVNYLSMFNNKIFRSTGCNEILDNADNGKNELKRIIIADCNNVKRVEFVPYSFRYKIVDQSGRNVYSDQLISDVLSHVYIRPKIRGRWTRRYMTKTKFKFRYDPVPNVHKLSGGHYYRAFSHLRDLRSAADPEISCLIRPSRNLRNLPNPYDLERVRDYQRNWKSQGKYRKQWEHNLYGRNNMDTVKGFNKRHLDYDEYSILMDEDIA